MKLPLIHYDKFPVRLIMWIAFIIFLIWFVWNEIDKWKRRNGQYRSEPLQAERVTRFWRDD